MKELSIFIDESGDFGEYDEQTPYNIITMVFHEQSHSISDTLTKLDQELSYNGKPSVFAFRRVVLRKAI